MSMERASLESYAIQSADALRMAVAKIQDITLDNKRKLENLRQMYAEINKQIMTLNDNIDWMIPEKSEE